MERETTFGIVQPTICGNCTWNDMATRDMATKKKPQ